ncbi:MAG: alkaline phosphatase [Bacteroidales bacterium]|nr:alkaline phosphatase [Bacteroidales bacterium]
MKKSLVVVLSLVLLSLSFNSCTQKKVEEAPKAVNVIYMIGDGMALPQVYATMLATGEDLTFCQFPYTGIVDTHSASNDITDSAAGGTALACDKKTKNGMVGMDPDTLPMPTILDVLAEHGKSTGIVVTCYSGHATPADFYAKVPKRSMYEDIAMQMAESDKLNVMIGGGRKHFDHRKDSINLIERMETELGWKVYDTLADIDTACMKYAVLANKGHMPHYPERGEFLPEGVKTALKTLEQDEDGFFLMVEGSQIDFACHAADSAWMVNETVDFSNAVQVAIDYAKTHGNTLVVVTADHETGGLTMIDRQGKYTNVEFDYSTGSHTCLPVMIYAYGPGAEQFTGWMQNCDVKAKILKACGIEPTAIESTTGDEIAPVIGNFDSKPD